MDKLKQLQQKIAEIQTKSLVADDMRLFVKLVLEIVNKNKDELSQLSEENIQTIKDSVAFISQEHEKHLENVSNENTNNKKEIEKVLLEAKNFLKEIKTIKLTPIKNGLDGKDADEEVIIEKVLSKIDIPKYNQIELDNGEKIIEKINELPIEDEYKIDASHIKNLPKLNTNGSNISKAIYQLSDVSLNNLANNNILKYNSTTNLWENGTGGSGSTSFIGLTDVPASYAGSSLKAVRVNVGETALEFYTPSGGSVGPGTINQIAYFDSANTVASLTVATYPSLTELSYVKGVTSAIQTQIDNKQPLDSDLTTIAGLTATTDNFIQSKAGAWASRTVAQVKTDLGLTGTNSGDQTTIVGITGTKAQFDTAVTDGNILYVGDVTQYTDELAQDAVGAMVDSSLTYVDATPLLQRAALTGAITASAGSNTTALGSFTKAQLDTAVSDGNVMFDGDSIVNATANTWKVFYSDGSGVITELALGANGTFLQSNGAAVAPTFATPAGSGDMVLANAQTNSGIKTFLNTTMKLRNVANTFDGYFVNTNTADRIYTLKDAAGTLAFTSDITGTNSGTNTGDQTITLTGDITGSGTGSFATTIAAGVIVNADINAAAAIDATKIADGSVTSAEFQFINTLSSNAQTQIDSKTTKAFAIAMACAL